MSEMPEYRIPAEKFDAPPALKTVQQQEELSEQERITRDQIFMAEVGKAMDLTAPELQEWKELTDFYSNIPEPPANDANETREWNADVQKLTELKRQTRLILTAVTQAKRASNQQIQLDDGRYLTLVDAKSAAKRTLVRFLLMQNEMIRKYTNEEPYELPEFLVAPLTPKQDVIVKGTRALLRTQYDLTQKNSFIDIEPKDLTDQYNLVLRALIERNYRLGKLTTGSDEAISDFLSGMGLKPDANMLRGYSMILSLLEKHKKSLDTLATKSNTSYGELRLDDALAFLNETPDIAPVANAFGTPLMELATSGNISSMNEVYSKLNESLSVSKMQELVISNIKADKRFQSFDQALLEERVVVIMELFTLQHEDIAVKDEMDRLEGYSNLDKLIASYILKGYASTNYVDSFSKMISVARDDEVENTATTDLKEQAAFNSTDFNPDQASVKVSDALRLYYLNSIREQSNNKSGNIFMLLKTIEVLKKGSDQDRLNALTLELRIAEFLEQKAEQGLINGVSSLKGEFPELPPELEVELSNMTSYLASEFGDRLKEAAHVIKKTSWGTRIRVIGLAYGPYIIVGAIGLAIIGLRNMPFNRLAKFKRSITGKTPSEIRSQLGLDEAVTDQQISSLQDQVSHAVTNHQEAKGILNAPTRLGLLIDGYRSKWALQDLEPEVNTESTPTTAAELDAIAAKMDGVGAAAAENVRTEADNGVSTSGEGNANPGTPKRK